MWIWICILLSKAVLGQINNGDIAVVIESTDQVTESTNQNCCRMANITETYTRYIEKCFTTYVRTCHYEYDDNSNSEPCNSGCNQRVGT